MPLLDLPVVEQRDDYSCGAAVFAAITRYWEGRGRRLKSHPHYGTPPDALELAFVAAGYRVLAGSYDVETLRRTTAWGWPVAALVQSDDGGHWVAVRGVYRRRVHLMDPAAGLAAVGVAEWQRRWSDFDRRGSVFTQYGVAAWCE